MEPGFEYKWRQGAFIAAVVCGVLLAMGVLVWIAWLLMKG